MFGANSSADEDKNNSTMNLKGLPPKPLRNTFTAIEEMQETKNES